MEDDSILDVPEVAILLRAEASTVMRFVRSGELPGTRIGKSWLFLRADVMAFLKSQIEQETATRRRHVAALETTPNVSAVVLPNREHIAAARNCRPCRLYRQCQAIAIIRVEVRERWPQIGLVGVVAPMRA